MKRKECIRCNKIMALSKFRIDEHAPNGYYTYCRACEKEYQVNYRATNKRAVKSYDLVLLNKKGCSSCGVIKKKEEFNLHSYTKSGLESSCRTCLKEKQKIYKKSKDYQPYSITHPEKWKAYMVEYSRQYKSDPIVGKRQSLAAALWRMVKDKLFVKPKAGCKCMECNTKCAAPPKAYFPDKYVYSLFRTNKIDKNIMVKNIIWLCSECICKKRKTNEV